MQMNDANFVELFHQNSLNSGEVDTAKFMLNML